MRSRSGRSVRIALTVVTLSVFLVSCRSAPGFSLPTDAPSPTASDASVAPSPSQSPSSSAPASPEPAPSGPSRSDVTIITLEVKDGAVEVSGILAGIVESGGTCTLTITLDGGVHTVSGSATEGRDSTYCGLVSIPISGLASGEWTAVLSYNSTARTAHSAPAQFQVP